MVLIAVLVSTVLAIAALMLVINVRDRNHRRINEGCPTIFQELRHKVSKDATPLPRNLDDIKEVQARQYALEIITFVVRFVCRHDALTRLAHPAYGTVRDQLNEIIEDALLAAEVIDPADATLAQQTTVCRLIQRDTSVCDELLRYCLSHPAIICGLRASLIDPRVFKRSVIRNNMLLVPSVAAMNWLRLTREALANAS